MKKSVLFLAMASMFVLASCDGSGIPGGNPLDPKPSPTPSSNEKCKAADYKQVKINGKMWMAENYRCSKYDTESEAFKAGIKTVTTKKEEDYYPAYYVDATIVDNWDQASQKAAGILTKEQIKKFGYLYNWSAAVGLANGISQRDEFSGVRQGICPNGWHIPTATEFYLMKKYILDSDGSGFDTAGTHLKTTTGWKQGDGLDTYEFAALPSGRAFGGSLEYFTTDAWYWTATVTSQSEANFYKLSTGPNFQQGTLTKGYAFSVRCVKN